MCGELKEAQEQLRQAGEEVRRRDRQQEEQQRESRRLQEEQDGLQRHKEQLEDELQELRYRTHLRGKQHPTLFIVWTSRRFTNNAERRSTKGLRVLL